MTTSPFGSPPLAAMGLSHQGASPRLATTLQPACWFSQPADRKVFLIGMLGVCRPVWSLPRLAMTLEQRGISFPPEGGACRGRGQDQEESVCVWAVGRGEVGHGVRARVCGYARAQAQGHGLRARNREPQLRAAPCTW